MLNIHGDVYIYLKKKIGEMRGTPYVSMCAVIHGKNKASVWINKIKFILPEGGLKQTIVDNIEKDNGINYYPIYAAGMICRPAETVV